MEKQNPQDICKSKKAYKTESMVKSFLHIENSRGSRDYYLCETCNKYHVYKTNNNDRKLDKKLKKELSLINRIKKKKLMTPKPKDRKKRKKH